MHVRVNRQYGLVQREAGDRVGRVPPGPGTSVRSTGQPRDVIMQAEMHIDRAPVVAEPLPLADHVGDRSCRELLGGGQRSSQVR